MSILSSAFLAALPLIDILPPVFVWYEYNTVTTLAIDPLSWVSAFLIIGAFIKLFNHVASLILVLKKDEIKKIADSDEGDIDDWEKDLDLDITEEEMNKALAEVDDDWDLEDA